MEDGLFSDSSQNIAICYAQAKPKESVFTQISRKAGPEMMFGTGTCIMPTMLFFLQCNMVETDIIAVLIEPFPSDIDPSGIKVKAREKDESATTRKHKGSKPSRPAAEITG